MGQAGEMAQATLAEPEYRVLISASHPLQTFGTVARGLW